MDHDTAGKLARRQWAVLAVLTMVAFVTNVDATIVVVALPKLTTGLHTSVTVGLWTLTAYIITSTVLLLPAGRMSDMIGGKPVLLAGLAIFTVATVLCGVAPSGADLVAARFLQGAGGALALATATPLIVDTFPSDRLGMAIGVNSTGPVAGGALVTSFGWRSVFFVTVPFGLVGIVSGALVLPRPARSGQRARIDWTGMSSFTGALVLLLLALSEGQAWGWASARIVALLVLAAALVAIFAAWELRTRVPAFDLRLLRRHQFRWGLTICACYSVGFFATPFVLSFYLQGALHLSALDAGLAMVPLSAPQLLLAPIGGALADRVGPARLMAAGAALLMLGAGLLARVGPRLDLVALVAPLCIMSVANSLLWPSLVKAVMSALPAERNGVGAGLFYTVRNVGMALSLTLALVIAEASLPKATASRVFIGTAGPLSPGAGHALVSSTDAGFTVFVAFYGLALIGSAGLLRRTRSRWAGRPVMVEDLGGLEDLGELEDLGGLEDLGELEDLEELDDLDGLDDRALSAPGVPGPQRAAQQLPDSAPRA
jgi:EmrB/QacA subfamily drug resistance transporter